MSFDITTYAIVIACLSAFGFACAFAISLEKQELTKGRLVWMIIMSLIFSLSFLPEEPRTFKNVYNECLSDFNIHSYTNEDKIKDYQNHCIEFAKKKYKEEK